MIFYIEGILAHQFEDSVVLDANGVGYQVFVPTLDIESLSQAEEKIKLFKNKTKKYFFILPQKYNYNSI